MSDFNKSLSQRKSNVLFAAAATLLFSALLFQLCTTQRGPARQSTKVHTYSPGTGICSASTSG